MVCSTTATGRWGDSGRNHACCARQLGAAEAELIERRWQSGVGERLPANRAPEVTPRLKVLQHLGGSAAGQAFLFNKLLTGWLRVGVSQDW